MCRFNRSSIFIASALSVISFSQLLSAQQTYRFQDTHLPAEDRISDLISHLTIEEKVQALSTNPTIPRLGVVGTQHVEGLHGLALGGPAGWEGKNLPVIPTTQFPQSRGLGQTWDPALIQKAAAAEGYETRYAYGKYHRGGMVVRAPNADLSRDPRWGRSEESYGEDPFLVGTMATAFTRGLQGDDPHVWLTSSLLKHFLANSNEDGRDGSSSNFDERLFREYYSVPFRMAIQQRGANAMMTAYNGWNGVPMIENPVLSSTVIKEWGFDGIICTDGGALTNLVTHHHAFKTMSEAAAAAIHAGINQFLDDYRQPVMDALKENLITEQEIDANIRGVFRVMLRLGMLDPAEEIPYAKIGTVDQAKGDPWNWPERHALVRQVTDESIVLLKNDHNMLPFRAETIKKIAVIGPLADRVALDWYSGTPPYIVTPLAGIRARAGSSSSVTFSKGDDVTEAIALAGKADVVIMIVGNHPTCDAGWFKCALPSEGKEAIDRNSLTLEQEELVKAVYAANPKTVVVLQTSFPYTTNWTQEHIPAILQITHNSEEQGNALADVIFGDYNPAGRLTQTWVSSIDQLPSMMDYDLRHGRTYLYLKQKPLYAFGFGLSYTTFAYSNLHVSTSSLAQNGDLTITADIRNTGARDGDEVVQLYVAYPHSAVSRPIEELKGFERMHLHSGESRAVTLHLSAQSLEYWNETQHTFVIEPGPIELRVGASSDDIKLSKTLNVTR
jgi:beta-glucosidase